jgi:hypothetical protein
MVAIINRDRLLKWKAHPTTQRDWERILAGKINHISNLIHKSTLKGKASWVIMNGIRVK